MERAWIYGVAIMEDEGEFVVSVRDLPEVVTTGASLDEALLLAEDAIAMSVLGRIRDQMELDKPIPPMKGEHSVRLQPSVASKATMYKML